MSKDGYFAASNSGGGFKNYYSEVFGGAGRIYVVKGGPGTGKSRFMRDVSVYAKARGWEAEYYYCSSDAESLDGVLLRRGSETAAIIDGTAPHVWEPSLPGVHEEIVNLGVFWNAKVLRASGDGICKLIRRRADLWRLAYRWLSGCLDMCGVIRSIGEACVRYNAVSDTASMMLAGIPDGDKWNQRTALLTSIGMGGVVSSDEFRNRAKELYIIRDKFMTAHILMKKLLEEAKAKRLEVIVSYDPIDADRPDGILIENGAAAVVVTEADPGREYKIIKMEKLIDVPENNALRQANYAERCRTAMLQGAIDTLAEIKECHFKLESIYTSAMDFPAKEAFTKEFCKKYFED